MMAETRQGLTVLPFAPAALGLYADVTDAMGAVVPRTAAEALAATGAAAVLDGPMFHRCSGQPDAPTEAERYRRATCAKLDYLHYDPRAGVRFAGSTATAGRGMVLQVVGSMQDAVDVVPVAQREQAFSAFDGGVAVQLYPALVQDGRALGQSTAGSNGSAEWRAALGELDDGRMAFAVGAYTMQDFANRLALARFRRAGYTDGGGSTRLALASGQTFGASEDRRVASWITVGATRGMGAGGALIAAGLAAALAYYVWRQR